jgi:hypothetical protein
MERVRRYANNTLKHNCHVTHVLLDIKHKFFDFKHENSCFFCCEDSDKIVASTSCRAYYYSWQVDNSTQALASATMPILRLLRTAAFGPEATETLDSAFDAAWDVLRRSGSTLVANDKAVMTREVLAKQIIAVGRIGERNQERLVKDALTHVASCETISRGVGRLRAKRNRRESNQT